MNVTQIQILLACAAAVVAFAPPVFICVRARRVLRDLVAVAAEQESAAAELSRELAAATTRADDLARRVAWLESRARTIRRTHETETTQEPHAGAARAASSAGAPRAETAPAAPNMTERRHRVLTLARKGMRGPAIADTLGMPRGEVELIINLGNIG
jgi:DNA-binding NarL/FixJ family response regulator